MHIINYGGANSGFFCVRGRKSLEQDTTANKDKCDTKISRSRKLLVFILVCLSAYFLTIDGIPGRITIIEGSFKELELSKPFDLHHITKRLDLLPFEGGVKLVPLTQGETSLEVRLWDIFPIR